MKNTKESPVEVHKLLGNNRRRLVIGYLSLFNPGTTVTVRHVARVVRGIETNTPPSQIGTEEYESAYNGLIQRHLPKLDSAEVLKYDKQRKEMIVTEKLEKYALVTEFTKYFTQIK